MKRLISRRTALASIGIVGIASGATLLGRRPRAKRSVFLFQPAANARYVALDVATGTSTELPFGDDGQLWIASLAFDDGRSLLVWSCPWEPVVNKPGFTSDYPRTPTRIWALDCASRRLRPIGPELYEHMEPICLFPDESGMLVNVIHPHLASDIFGVDWNLKTVFGFKDSAWGERYGFDWNPPKTRLAFHVAGPAPRRYWICTSDVRGDNATVLCNQYEKGIFGPQWSPDGATISCIASDWSGDDHEGSDVYLIDPATRRCRTLDVLHWSTARSGPLSQPTFGTNLPSWAPDGSLIVCQMRPQNAHSPFHLNHNTLVDDHNNSSYQPGGIGGTELLNVQLDGRRKVLVPYAEHNWLAQAAITEEGDLVYRHWNESDPERLRWTIGTTEIGNPHRTRGIRQLRL